MKKLLLILLSILLVSPAVAEITLEYGEAGDIAFYYPEKCSVVVLFMGQDSTSWDLDSVAMSPVFTADSTNFLYDATISSYGVQILKVNYWLKSSSTVKRTYTTTAYVAPQLDEVYATINRFIKLIGYGHDDSLISISHYAAAADTIFVIDEKATPDTIGYIVAFHPGGEAGGEPDSFKTYVGGP